MSTDPRGSTPSARGADAARDPRPPGSRRTLRRPSARSLERLSDEELVGQARSGAPEPFEVLWHRHADAGRRVASRFTRASDPDDLVQEAYLRIYSAVSRGKGPDGPFRPYLYRSIRNIAITWAARPQTDSVDLLPDLSDGTDITESVLEGTVTATAFRTLPRRWQEVLWYSEVEGLDAADIGPLLGLKTGAVSALAYRAREGLRRAWLQAHVSSTALPEECRWSAEHMGDANRGALTGTARERFDEHVDGCTRCTILVAEVDEVSSRLGLVLVPLLVGVPWATFESWGGAASATTATAISTTATATTAATSTSVGTARGRTAASGRRGRPTGLVVAVVAGVVVVSAGVAVGAALLRSTGATPAATSTAAVPQVTPGTAAPATVPTSPPESEEPVGDLEDAPTVDLPPGEGLDVEKPDDAPLPTLPPTAEPLPPLPTLPPLAPVPQVVNPVPVPPGPPEPSEPSEPSEPTGPVAPAVPTLTGPPGGTPLTTFPTVSGTADPGVAVIVVTTAGDEVASTVADPAGTWSVPVCQDTATAPAACVADTDSLTVEARARDDETGLESAASPGLTWTFDRPSMAAPIDGAVVVLPASGDVVVRLEGAAGQSVQVSIDGVATGRFHTMPRPEDLMWRGVTPGTHTLSVRYVTVSGSGDGAVVTGYGPNRTSTVTVVAPERAPSSPPGGAPDEPAPPLEAGPPVTS